jgi:predicted O-methyltransferase YrrM
MELDSQFFSVAGSAFNPFVSTSGTEHVGPLLYSIARMIRPRSIVEYGTGYTTLFLLAACDKNAQDFIEEAESLHIKTAACIPSIRDQNSSSPGSKTAWFESGGKACGVDPSFYLETYEPRLYCFDRLEKHHSYSERLSAAVRKLELDRYFCHLPGHSPNLDLLPREAFPIDLAWNDDDQYMNFFEAVWPMLNPSGGIIAFHNTTAVEHSWETIKRIKQEIPHEEVECFTFNEPHKLNQNSCTIMRKVSQFQPSFKHASRERILTDLMRFMEQRS